MAFLSNLKISKKVGVVIFVLSAAAAVIASMGYYGLTTLTGSAQTINIYGSAANAGSRMAYGVMMMNRAEYRIAANLDPRETRAAEEKIIEGKKIFEDNFTRARNIIATPSRIKMLGDIEASYKNYLTEVSGTLRVLHEQTDLKSEAAHQAIYAETVTSRGVVNQLSAQILALTEDVDRGGDILVNDMGVVSENGK